MSALFLLFILFTFVSSFFYPYLFILFFLLVAFYLYRYKNEKKKLFVLLILECFFIGLRSIHIKSTHYEGIVVEAKENYYLFSSLKGSFYVSEKNNQKEEGDILTLKGKIEPISFITLESQFDFQDYLKKKGYRYEIKVEGEKKHFLQPFRKKKWLKELANHFDVQTYAVIKKLFFNYGTKENSALIDDVTELHFYTLLSFGTVAYSWLLKRIEKKKSFFSFLFLLPFYFLRPTRLFFKRLFYSCLIEAYLNHKKIHVSHLKRVSYEAIILLLFQPFYAFQIEYRMTYSILLLTQLLLPFLYSLKKRKKKVVIFLSIQGIVMLFQAYSNYSVNLLTPVLSLLMPLFYALQLLILLFSYLSLYSLSKFFVLIYQKMVQELKYFSFPINVGFIPFSFILFLLILFIYLCIKIIRKERKKSIAVEVIMISILMIRTFPIQLKKNQISFINVGQGDATLIENDGVNILVDTGGLSYVNIAEDVLIPYFKKKRIKKIHHLIITHNDFDHSGAKIELIQKKWVQNIHEIDEDFPLQLSSFTIHNLNLWRNEATNENDRSFVLSFQAHQTSVLLMGDASKEIESKLLYTYPSLHHDILKLGHHGSSTSSSLSFLNAVNPQIAIISCGKNNRYGHPNQETIANLKELNISYYRTDEEGTLTFSLGKSYSFFFAYRYLWYTYKRNKEGFYALSFIWPTRNDS